MIEFIIFFLVFVLLIIFLFRKVSSKSKLSNVITSHHKKHFNDAITDIKLEPYGCFSNLKGKFFLKKINPYSRISKFDSGIIISDTHQERDVLELIKQVIDNGYDLYGTKIYKKYFHTPDKFKYITIEELGALGKLAGYNYLSIYKIDKLEKGSVYLTYSPPMDTAITDSVGMDYTQEQYDKNLTKSDLSTYTLTPKLNKYTDEEKREPEKELSCGHPCLPFGEPMTFKDSKGDIRQYMCGSVAYPNIKTPPRYAVYKIVET